MKRSKHSLSHYRLFTCDAGELVPIACFPVLPGDTVQQATSLLLRASPLNTPVMHPASVRVHHWFVPNRLIWADWEKFITGGSDGLGEGSTHPTITITPAVSSLADYLGLPTGTSVTISALPFRAYSKIWNEFYRDEDLDTALVVNTASGADATTNTTLKKVRWEKDYFTSARPWATKGSAITMPLGTSATVKTTTDLVTGAQSHPMRMRQVTAGAFPAANKTLGVDTAGSVFQHDTAVGANPVAMYPTNLYADLSSATAVSVDTVRRAFALQRFQEARAQYGHRYTEYLRYLGVRSSDARLQRPEYLGGGKQTISFSEVLQTGTNFGDNNGVGTLRGHGISALRSRRYRRFFEEHGLVISLLSVRPRTMYQDGVPREWLKTTREDYWQRELQQIGQQTITNREIRSAHASPTGTFGYQDRYAEYRRILSGVSGDFRSTLNMWHWGRIFGADPTLNASFVECDPATRIFASAATDTLWCMASHSIQARRMVTRSTIGKVV